MRDTFTTTRFEFTNIRSRITQSINRICLHRNGNPGATALNTLNWGNREQAFNIHAMIEDEVVFTAIAPGELAYHIREWRLAAAKGFEVDVPGFPRKRGDYGCIGIETSDIKGGGLGQEYSLSQETRISLLLYCRDIVQSHDDITADDILEHANYDPWTREKDLGDALYIPDFRQDLRELLAGMEPWRTVQEFAYGRPAPPEWEPLPPTVPNELVVEGLIDNALARLDGIRDDLLRAKEANRG